MSASMRDLALVTAAMAIGHVSRPATGYEAAWQRVMAHLSELQGLADTLAGMTTEAEMDGDMSGDDAVSTLSDMIEQARPLSPRRPASAATADMDLPDVGPQGQTYTCTSGLPAGTCSCWACHGG